MTSEGLFAADVIDPPKPSSEIVAVPTNDRSLIALVQKAASQLASATSAAEVLEAKEYASVAYDASKKAARLAKAKGAHDELIAKAHRAQADALQIESEAKRRLADEYDAAQERGEVAGQGKPSKAEGLPQVADIGLTHKEIHEARTIRDAEKIEPGIVQRVVEEKLAAGQEPTKAALREAVIEVAKQGYAAQSNSSSNRNPHYRPPSRAGESWTKLYGSCRSLSEWATEENIKLAVNGLAEREDDQMSNIAAVQKARDILNNFLGEINA